MRDSRVKLAALCLLLLLATSRTASGQEISPIDSTSNAQTIKLPLHSYKEGQTWPLTLVNGIDFLEPFVPVAAFERGDAGRIVLGTAMPYALLVSAFAAEGTDKGTLKEIDRRGWNWCGLDQSQDNYPFMFGLVALGGLSSFLPAPDEDQDGYSLTLRLDRLAVFGAAVGIANAEVEILKPVFDRVRPNGTSHASRPSGHAVTGFAAMAFMSDVLRDTFRPQDEPNLGLRALEETASVVPYLGAFYLALERVHGQKHFLTDTLLGGALGTFTTQMLDEWSFLRVELGSSWLASFELAYEPGGFQLAWRREF